MEDFPDPPRDVVTHHGASRRVEQGVELVLQGSRDERTASARIGTFSGRGAVEDLAPPAVLCQGAEVVRHCGQYS
jgi:hypothetical protein